MADESEAIREGRRIYVGNLLYAVSPTEIGDVLKDNGFGAFEHIHVSVDPVTGRNPGYCFVDFETADAASGALEALKGQPIRGRPIKTGPCIPKQQPHHRFSSSNGHERKPLFQRWGDWNGDEVGAPVSGEGPYGAEERLAKEKDIDWRRRVYVGGLGNVRDQAQNDQEIREMFKGLDITALSKRITAHKSTWGLAENQNYCFVDMASVEEVVRAINTLHGIDYQGGKLRVSRAKGPPSDVANRVRERS